MKQHPCFHCGDPCGADAVPYDGKDFCCTGCKTVYQILRDHQLDYYYELEAGAGRTPGATEGKYDFLDDPDMAGRLLDFQDDTHQVITLNIPAIHCSSCIWILENLHRLNPGVLSSQVDFPRKEARIHFNPERIGLKTLVQLLAAIGYEPSITLEQYSSAKPRRNRKLIYQLGVAGFAFGNIMFLSFPEYFETGEYWIEQYKGFFRWLMFALSLPVVLYSASGYLTAAYKGLRSRLLNIDVPIALGILVLFMRSTVEIAMDWGSGYFDSLTGLVFFLLLGKYFQQRTYAFLSFERDYRSYFPIAVTRLRPDGAEENVPVYEVAQGDRLLIRSQSLIPADAILQKGQAEIDYSFVTGEARPVHKAPGEKIFAGGKQLQGAIEIEVLKPVSQSYLTELWSDSAFSKNHRSAFRNLTDRIGKRFTLAVLTIAFTAAGVWLGIAPARALDVLTAVLIIACPCAIALAAPFTLGNLLRRFGRKGFYVKDTDALERMAQVDTLIFDKTGTLSTTRENSVSYTGIELTEAEAGALRNLLRASGHPLSQTLYRELAPFRIVPLDHFEEHLGLGLEGEALGQHLKVGSRSFVKGGALDPAQGTEVHVSANDAYKGCFHIHNSYRKGMGPLFDRLRKGYRLALLSGDNPSEQQALENLLPPLTPMYFEQSPMAKLHFVRELQQEGQNVLMVGDGLNDAGALAQSDVGIAISEDAHLFTPACDAILDYRHFAILDRFLAVARKGMGVIRISFALSLLYNLVGLYFAVTGQLQPVIAAILMPLSSISIVVFTTVASNWIARKLE
ncbi:heavy metal translocating P-type ATPase metal-binding domain-containing protein [Robiginitalea sp. M366]|uniref:heavy metal translocating P-type ATPase n=1 Tax=Robiginitalea aestuariiviva TaxID=3036903 RepID=UPI00240CFEEB|nr:heavy metal translocating P-type ATPase metal-binding domain-containing protein [Robiginitalea aestuariiviva]MDG1571113.1 heavy metal translocating P-type ATPase metal-binding domain-containing protein [Robiginitalea aestuariiviva]